MPEKNRTDIQAISENIQEILRKLESVQNEARWGIERLDFDLMTQQVARIPEIETSLRNLESEIEVVRTRLEELKGRSQQLNRKLRFLHPEFAALTAALRRLEERFDDHDADRLTERLRTLADKVATLQKNAIH